MSTAVVQGASGGLGLGFVRELLGRGVALVHATCRHPEGSEGLQALLEAEPERLRLHRLDLGDDASIEAAGAAVLEQSPKLTLVVQASGLLHRDGLRPERRVEALDRARLLEQFEVNAVGPLLVVKALLPGILHGDEVKLVSLSARVGSIGDNRRGGWYGYRSSKAALNQLHRSLAVELRRRAKNAISVVLHPGTVRTELTAPFRRSVPEGQLMEVESSVRKLMDVIDGLGPSEHGGFFDYDGRPIEW